MSEPSQSSTNDNERSAMRARALLELKRPFTADERVVLISTAERLLPTTTSNHPSLTKLGPYQQLAYAIAGRLGDVDQPTSGNPFLAKPLAAIWNGRQQGKAYDAERAHDVEQRATAERAKEAAIQKIQHARYVADPIAVANSPTLRMLDEEEKRAADRYQNLGNGSALGVKERAAQHVDRLLERIVALPESRTAAVVVADAIIDGSRRKLEQLRRDTELLATDARVPHSERSALARSLAQAEERQAWSTVPTDRTERPLLSVPSHHLYYALTVLKGQENGQLPPADRVKGELLERELDYRRREVASGARAIDRVETDLGHDPASTGRRVLRDMDHYEPVKAAAPPRHRSAASEPQHEAER